MFVLYLYLIKDSDDNCSVQADNGGTLRGA